MQQIGELIRNVVACCEGPHETDIVMALIRLRDEITGWSELGDDWDALIGDSRAKLEQLVNEFFKAKLLAIPEVEEFLGTVEQHA